MLLGARQFFERRGAKVPTAADYVQTGLVAMWDGIENAGWGVHNPNATVWKNLVNGDTFNIKSGNSFSADALVTTVRTDYGAVPMYSVTEENAYTFEVVGASLVSGTNIGGLPYSGGPVFNAFANWSATSSYCTACGGNMSVNDSGPVGKRKSFGLRVSGDSWTLFSAMFGVEKSGTWTKTASRYGGTVNANVEECSIRLYSRALTAAEIAHNYAIDKLRFNLS